MKRTTTAATIVTIALLTAGCPDFKIVKPVVPPSGSFDAGPGTSLNLPSEVTWNADMKNLEILLDAKPVTSQFNINSVARKAITQPMNPLAVSLGKHQLRVQGQLKGLFGYSSQSATLDLNVIGSGGPIPGGVSSGTGTGGGTTTGPKPRKLGSFSEITNNVKNKLTNRSCQPDATYAVEITPGNVTAKKATFRDGTNSIVTTPLEFNVGNAADPFLGGAGFSECDIGIVLDANATRYSPQLMALSMIDLKKGKKFDASPYTFNYNFPSGGPMGSMSPAIYRSPDGTILMVITAATTGPQPLRVAFFDLVNDGKEIGFCSIGLPVKSAGVVTGNKINYDGCSVLIP